MIQNRSFATACLALLGTLALGSVIRCADAAEDLKPRRWAIIATEEGQNTGLADLMAIHVGEWGEDRTRLA